MKEVIVSNIYKVSFLLQEKYKNNSHNNKKNPLDELIYILLSVQTQENSYQTVYLSFKKKFPRFDDQLLATEREIARTIYRAGLSRQRAKAIKENMNIIEARFGKPTLAPLHKMSNQDIEEFLGTLPRVGTKVARCIMMYSLGREVFPVDTHVWRITRRLGWIRPTNKEKSCRKKDMDRLQEKIPPELRYSLHVNMVSLGREICKPKNPSCSICPIEKFCRKIRVVKH